MASKPILFSTPMVKAILDDRKSMTRRVIKPQPLAGVRKSVFVKSGLEDGHGSEIKPKYQSGDILWVRETWAKLIDSQGNSRIVYRASDKYPFGEKYIVKFKWKPSIFMPREAARIFLKVTNVRAQMLCNMTTIDFLNEGIELYKSDGRTEKSEIELEYEFEDLWDSLNKKRGYGWDTNPYVWVYEFERVEGMKC